MNTLGARIHRLRIEKGMTQVALAKACGVSPPSISQLESGKSKSLKGPTLLRMAVALEANPYYIQTGKGDQKAMPKATEAEILDVFRGLTPEQQAAFLAAAKALRG